MAKPRVRGGDKEEGCLRFCHHTGVTLLPALGRGKSAPEGGLGTAEAALPSEPGARSPEPGVQTPAGQPEAGSDSGERSQPVSIDTDFSCIL